MREALGRLAPAASVAARSWLDAALATCLAPRCAVCDRGLHAPTAGAVCEACWGAVAFFTPPLCAACGAPLACSTRGDAAACRLCAQAPLRDVDRAAALGLHEGPLRDIVHALKFGRRYGLARRLAGHLSTRHAHLLAGMDAVVPVPLHVLRRRKRGFNQAHELARHLGLPVLGALRRTRHTAPQSSLDGRARHRNVDGAFALSWRLQAAHAARAAYGARRLPVRRPLDGWRVTLVDDVWTTGATLSACARVLKSAGAREVAALVIARAVPSRLR